MKWPVKLKREAPAPPAPEAQINGPPVIVEAGTEPAIGQAVQKLSPREAEVFQCLLKGAKMKDIAEELNIKTSTVNGYCREIYRQLGVNSKALLILRYSNFRESRGIGVQS